MGISGSIIAESASVGLLYAQRLLKGIPEDRAARNATPGGTQIVSNHPTFIIGHLCLYPLKVLELLGEDTSPATVPDNFEALFSKTAICEDDSDGQKYPPLHEIVSVFETTYAAALNSLRNASDEKLAAENPVDTPMRKNCTTLGSLLNFYMTSHVMTHLGQLSAWRRMDGLPPA